MKYDKILIIEGVAHALIKDEQLHICDRCSLDSWCRNLSGIDDVPCDVICGYASGQYRFKDLTPAQLVQSLNEHRAERVKKVNDNLLTAYVYKAEDYL